MRTCIGSVFSLLLLFVYHTSAVQYEFIILILDQPSDLNEANANLLIESIVKQASNLNLQVRTFRTSKDFDDLIGTWAVWPALSSILTKTLNETFDWVFVCEDETSVDLARLHQVLAGYPSDEGWFLGHALRDRHPTIIHHYAFINDPGQLAYPDFAAGLAISRPLFLNIADRMRKEEFSTGFTIDPKHELAMLFWNNGSGSSLTNVPELCSKPSHFCAALYTNSIDNCKTEHSVNFELKIAVKTCSKFHKTRITVVKKTWASGYEQDITYYSDQADTSIPSVDIGLSNTERGHCGKTIGIMKKFNDEHPDNEHVWLGIVDDDTLLSMPRLRRLLKCHHNNFTGPLVVGERYGYGFNARGTGGYDYPTGGSGMFFSPAAARLLSRECRCPAADSPDDMVVGMCASHLNVPVVHSAALHQARPADYAAEYVARLKPVSFHKHYEVDPVQVYEEYLREDPHSEIPKQEL